MYKLFRQCRLCSRDIKVLHPIYRKRRHFSQEKVTKIKELSTAYKPHDVEKLEIDEDYFSSCLKQDQAPFTLILPPPNITGTLHLGHALTVTIQDSLVKWYKMKGIETIWIPGLDHAGIATQVIVEKKLWKEKGITRHQLGREKFKEEVWKWKNEKSFTIVQQLHRLNVSLNWEKEVFTMDKKRSQAVTEAFIELFNQGLIYRADHLVNWSCVLQSAISDIEVDHITIEGPTDLVVPGYDKPVRFGVLTKFSYKLEDSDEEIIVATTRPETMIGDVAVAVNPKDTRYTKFIGKFLRHPFRNDLIPVIADDFVDPEFGTGAVKITPAHNPTDFDVSKRHNLRPLQVIDEKGVLTELCGDLKGVKRFDARETIISLLASMQMFKGSEDHNTTVPICSRSKDVVECLIRPQWFLNCSEMAEKALIDVREGRLKIDPPNFEKVLFQWLENIRDWCISRQLWWGHRIPAYSCFKKDSSNKKVWVAAENGDMAKVKASKLLNCQKDEIDYIQDEDVLDTWFSSGLQPMSVFGWPEKDPSFEKYYPLTLMETGQDILFFWVARMVMLGTHLTGRLPFNEILLHGIICDAHGRKMSKSLGNVIAPEDVIDGSSLEELKATLKTSYSSGLLSAEELNKALQGQQKMFPKGIPDCGADALRFSLLSHNVKSHVINFDVNECHTNRLFCNKIFQATKFTLLWIQKVSEEQTENFHKTEDNFEKLAPMDKWILSRLTYMIETVNKSLENHDFHIATSSLKNFLYYEYCDVYLESIKTDLKEKTAHPSSKGHCRTLLICLDLSLRALAPFMPALAQHLHKHLPRIWNIGMNTSFPKNLNLRDEHLEKNVDEISEIIVCIRRLKKIFNLTYKYKPEVLLITRNTCMVQEFSQVLKDLSHLYTLTILENDSPKAQISNLVEDTVGDTKVLLVVPDELMRNLELDLEQMEKKKEKLSKELGKLHKMMRGSGYKEKSTPEAQEIHMKKVTMIEEKIARISYIQNLTKQQKDIHTTV